MKQLNPLWIQLAFRSRYRTNALQEKRHLYSMRSAFHIFTVACLFCALCITSGQRAGREIPSRFMDRIDAEEGARRLADFRGQRLEGDFCFEFELEHKPRRQRTVRYKGIMWGTWNDIGPLTRVLISTPEDQRIDAVGIPHEVDLIIQNGEFPEAWIRHSLESEYKRVDGVAIFEPILPEILYSPFDLQMPFIYWQDFVYEGPALFGVSRVVQKFLMIAPNDSASKIRGIDSVRVCLDDTYNALWRIETMNEDDSVSSRFTVESFKKVQNQYIVKRITLTDYPEKNRTTFNVRKASVGVSLSHEIFNPHSSQKKDLIAPLSMENF